MEKAQDTLVPRLIRFLVVGGLATALNYGVYLALMGWFGVQYIVASTIGYASGIVAGYGLNKAWAFSAADESHRKVVPYLIVYGVNLASSQALLYVLVQRFGVPATWANVPVLAYTTVANFVGLHFLVFRAKSS